MPVCEPVPVALTGRADPACAAALCV